MIVGGSGRMKPSEPVAAVAAAARWTCSGTRPSGTSRPVTSSSAPRPQSD